MDYNKISLLLSIRLLNRDQIGLCNLDKILIPIKIDIAGDIYLLSYFLINAARSQYYYKIWHDHYAKNGWYRSLCFTQWFQRVKKQWDFSYDNLAKSNLNIFYDSKTQILKFYVCDEFYVFNGTTRLFTEEDDILTHKLNNDKEEEEVKLMPGPWPVLFKFYNPNRNSKQYGITKMPDVIWCKLNPKEFQDTYKLKKIGNCYLSGETPYLEENYELRNNNIMIRVPNNLRDIYYNPRQNKQNQINIHDLNEGRDWIPHYICHDWKDSHIEKKGLISLGITGDYKIRTNISGISVIYNG